MVSVFRVRMRRITSTRPKVWQFRREEGREFEEYQGHYHREKWEGKGCTAKIG